MRPRLRLALFAGRGHFIGWLLFLAACAGQPSPDHDAVLQAYVECNLAASHAVAPQAGDPLSLAVAAMGLCSKEKLAARKALLSTYRVDLAEAMIARADKVQIEENAAEIVRTRARLNALRTNRP